MDSNETSQAKYFGGKDYLKRLNSLFELLDICKINRYNSLGQRGGEFECMKTWSQNYGGLLSLFQELRFKMDPKDVNFHDDTVEYLGDLLEEARKEVLIKKTVNLSFLKEFDSWEIKLRKFAESKGLVMPDEIADEAEEDN